MKYGLFNLSWFSFFIFFISCETSSYLSLDDLKAYPLQEGSGLYKQVQVQSILIEFIYRPKDLIIAQNVDSNDQLAWEKEVNRLDSLDYFVLKISRQGEEIENSYAGDPIRYSQVISYLSNQVGNDIRLIQNQETHPVSEFIFVPSFGSSNATTVLLVFKSALSHSGDNFSILFDDAKFGTGRNEFKFKGSDIARCPRLKINV